MRLATRLPCSWFCLFLRQVVLSVPRPFTAGGVGIVCSLPHLPAGSAIAAHAGNSSWEAPAALRQGHERAVQAAELRSPYEEAIGGGRAADADLLAAYMAYVKVEERAGDPARVQARVEGWWVGWRFTSRSRVAARHDVTSWRTYISCPPVQPWHFCRGMSTLRMACVPPPVLAGRI
jgi:hypothetical protein